jgi:hypothetical protein
MIEISKNEIKRKTVNKSTSQQQPNIKNTQKKTPIFLLGMDFTPEGQILTAFVFF